MPIMRLAPDEWQLTCSMCNATAVVSELTELLDDADLIAGNPLAASKVLYADCAFEHEKNAQGWDPDAWRLSHEPS